MKMIRRYAIEPRALRRWEDFRYVMEKLGFAEGRVLVALPKKWSRELLDSLGDVADIERMRFTTKLQRYRSDRIVSSGTAYDIQKTWIDNASGLEASGKVDAVLISEMSSDIAQDRRYPTPAEVDEEFFAEVREQRCLGTPENLSAAASVLLEVSSEAILVDPYFNVASPRYLGTLAAFAQSVRMTGRCRCFVVFTKSDFLMRGGEASMRSTLERHLGRILPPGFKFQMNFIDAGSARISFHARYFFTEKGGIRYDKGFGTQQPPELVDISLIDRQLHNELLDVYRISNENLSISESWVWVSGD